MTANPHYPVQVEGWRGAVRQAEIDSLDQAGGLEALVESAYPRVFVPTPAEPRRAFSRYPQDLDLEDAA